MFVSKKSKITLAFVAASIAVVAVAAIVIDGLSGSELIVERTTTQDAAALVLDVEETRANAPTLARLLDEAAITGRASTGDDSEGLAAEAYLEQVRARQGTTPEGQPVVSWNGQQYLVYRVVR